MNTATQEIPNYSVLADIYDIVMKDVDYETWTDYIDDIILEHNPNSADVLELACGTGTMALSLEELECYNIVATDASPHMIRRAQAKADQIHSDVEFITMNFLDLQLDQKFDAVYMVFDSINYLHEEEKIIELHRQVKQVLKPGGIFIYDFTTPRNSRKAINYLNNEQQQIDNRYRYHRESLYSAKERVHTNRFLIEKLDQQSQTVVEAFREQHRQRIYTFKEITDMVKRTDFTILNAYDGFELKPAHKKSLRITMVLQ